MFLSGDSAAPEAIRAMLRTTGIGLYGFPQADAYVRRFPYLSKLEVPAGASLLQNTGDFPSIRLHEFPIGADTGVPSS